MSPTGPLYPATATDAGGAKAWTNVNNAKLEDGSVATDATVGPGGGGGVPNQLNLTNFGFNIPSTAIIDGIKLELKVQTTGGNTGNDSGFINLLYSGGSTASASTPNPGLGWPTGALTWITHGDVNTLWGKAWTPADINSSSFGASIAAFPPNATSDINVDSVRITVYWHTAPAIVPKEYVYKIFDSGGNYLGNLPNVTSVFGFSQDINTAGSQISVEIGVSADTSQQAVSALTDEAGNILTDEGSSNLTDEGVLPIIAAGGSTTNTLVRNGNTVQVWEFSYYYPNGKCMFLGQLQNWEATFGGSDGDTIKMLFYSDGQDLDNYLVRGNPYTYTQDVANTSQNANATISAFGGGWNRYGETWKVGAGVTNVGAITVKLNGTANVTVKVWDSIAVNHLLGSVTQAVSVGAATDVQFGFANSIVTTPGLTYFFTVEVDAGQSILIYYQNTDVYANGAAYGSNYGGGSGGGSWGILAPASDLYFKTFSGTGSTTGTFTSQDPTTGILETILNDYIARGGLITYTSSTITATNLSLTYGFNTDTVYTALGAVLRLSPNGFYYYVDLGTDVLYFKKINTVADIVLTKGLHLDNIHIVATIERLSNQIFFSGGVVAGSNIYVTDSDATSIGFYGPRLARISDNRVTTAATAHVISLSKLSEEKDEQYQSTVTVVDTIMDTTLLKPGLIIGFNGFGNFVDNLLTQIVSLSYSPSEVSLTLGILPVRLNPEFEKITRGLLAEQTIANPSTPS